MTTDIILRTCTKCKRELPATTEFFHKLRRGKYGLRPDCKQCSRERNHQYRAANPEYARQYREVNAEKLRESSRQYYEANSEKVCERSRQYQKANAERMRECYRRYREANAEKLREYLRRYRQTPRGKEVQHAKSHRRRALKADAPIGLPFDEAAQLKRQKSRCYYCGDKLTEYHIDHVIPLSRGGSDGAENKVLACPTCNRSKGAKLPSEWAKGGRLL